MEAGEIRSEQEGLKGKLERKRGEDRNQNLKRRVALRRLYWTPLFSQPAEKGAIVGNCTGWYLSRQTKVLKQEVI